MPPASLSRARGAVGLRLFILGVLDAAWWSQIALVRPRPPARCRRSQSRAGRSARGLLCRRANRPPAGRAQLERHRAARALRLATGSVVVIGLAGGVLALAGALVVFGVCNGVIDVTVNVQAVALERLSGRAIMSRLHAMWSLGTLLGALAGAGAIGARCRSASVLRRDRGSASPRLGTVLSGALLGAVADTPRPNAGEGGAGLPRAGPHPRPAPACAGAPG